MRLLILLFLLISPAVQAVEATVVAYSAFNGTKATLFAEKGECAQGAIAMVDMGKGLEQGCWIDKDGYIVIDLNKVTIGIPSVAFMIYHAKVFS